MKADDIYQLVTDRIIQQLDAGVSPWVKPWASNPALEWPANPTTGKRYSGFNAMFLNMAQEGFGTNLWATFKQIEGAGGMVKKGSKGIPVLRPIELTKTFKDAATGEEEEGKLTLFKGYAVFNLDQVDGLSHLRPAARTALNPVALSPVIEEAIARTGASIRHEGNRCFYDLLADRITMVEAGAFPDAQHYYGTKLHELVHWTGHPSRLARLSIDAPISKPDYGREELVAEIGSAFLCQHFGVDGIDRHQASYVGGWLAIIKEDKKAILKAASAAQRAFERIVPQVQP